MRGESGGVIDEGIPEGDFAPLELRRLRAERKCLERDIPQIEKRLGEVGEWVAPNGQEHGRLLRESVMLGRLRELNKAGIKKLQLTHPELLTPEDLLWSQ